MKNEKSIIVGLGNPYLGDDGIGIVVAEQLANHPLVNPREDVTITEASVGGLRLMETLVGYDRAILIDALVVPDPLPGQIHRWDLGDLTAICPTQHSASAHDTSLPTAIAAGRKIGLDLPDQIAIFAIEVHCRDEFSAELSYPIQSVIPEVIERVLCELGLETEARWVASSGENL
jgi:hydrogenase maturation protease